MNFFRNRTRGRLGPFARGDRGATAVEYSIMVGFIAVVIVVAVKAFGLSVDGLFQLVISTAPFN